MAKSEEYRRLINSRRWRRLRAAALRACPVCSECGARLTTEVHHAVPCEEAASPAQMEALMFDPSNLRAVCRQCHREIHALMGSGSSKVAKERARRQCERAVAGMFGGGGPFFEEGGGPSQTPPRGPKNREAEKK